MKNIKFTNLKQFEIEWINQDAQFLICRHIIITVGGYRKDQHKPKQARLVLRHPAIG